MKTESINKVILLNSAIMIDEGYYQYHKISQKEFVKYIQTAKVIKSYIGYPQNAEYIKKISGIDVEINREKTILDKPGSVILVMKLNYRMSNPNDKGKQINTEDYDFGVVLYSECLNSSTL